jgi:cytoskeletal protein RodZ
MLRGRVGFEMTAKETERLARVEQQVADGFRNVDDRLKEVIKRLDDADSKYAAKWVQVVVGGLVAAILLAFIGVVSAYFINSPSSNQPTTSTTTTTTTPTGSTATTSTQDRTPSSTANASAQSSTEKPTDSQTSNGGVDLTLPKLNP